MRRWALYIVFLWSLGAAAAELTGVPCGATVRLRATSPAGWHFDHWSDGSTDSVYLVEVHSDLHLIAYFAPSCEDFSLPAVALYDRLIMLDMRTIQALGYFFEPDTTAPSVQKILRNDQILILRGDKIYTIQGQEVK